MGLVNLLFDNDSGEDAWFAYYGLDPANGFKPAHADATGKLVPTVPSAKPTDAIAVKVTSGPFGFPMLSAARMYISFGAPLLLTVDGQGNPIPPQAANPSDPNYLIPWDFFEITYVPQAGTDGLFNFNLSCVQSANLPMRFRVMGAEPSTKEPVDYLRGWTPGGYAEFLTTLRANADFSKLVLPRSQRVLAPGTAITAHAQKVIPNPLIGADYLKAYIASVWTKFETVDLTFVGDPPPGSSTFVNWTGRVKNGQFTFTTSDLPLEPIVLNVPTTSDLFENNFLFCASGKGTPGSLQQNYALQLFGTLCAAFNRSVMLTTTKLANSSNCEWCKDVAGFYQHPTTNHYSKGVHANAIAGLAYAFQSDDHCDVSSYVSVINPTQLTITLDRPSA